MKTEKSEAYQLCNLIWTKGSMNSYRWLNQVMDEALQLAIKANLQFNENDFEEISKSFRGGYWYGCNHNGKGYGERYYSVAIEYNNTSAIKSYEKWVNIKPFITKQNHRLHLHFKFYDKERFYKVTGFDFDKKKIMIVSYEATDINENRAKKLHQFTNKEWLEFRKNIFEQ